MIPDSNSTLSEIWHAITQTILGRLIATFFLSGIGLTIPYLLLVNYLGGEGNWFQTSGPVTAIFFAGAIGGVILFRNWIFKR